MPYHVPVVVNFSVGHFFPFSTTKEALVFAFVAYCVGQVKVTSRFQHLAEKTSVVDRAVRR